MMIFYLRMVFIFLLSCPLFAGQDSIVLLAEKNSPALNNLYKNLKSLKPDFNYVISTKKTPAIIKADDLVILVGAKVPDYVDLNSHKKSMAVLVTEQQGKQLQDQVQTSIWLEPPLSRQLTLANLVIPGDKKIGFLVNGEENKRQQLSRLSSTQKAMLKVVDLNDYENINQALFHVLKDTRLLLGGYERDIYNAKTIKNILITSYRQQKVLIGPSRAYLKAGSFATTFSDLNQVALRIVDVIDHYHSSANWLKPDYNPYYRIVFNQQVARSLNIQMMDGDLLEQRMREQ